MNERIKELIEQATTREKGLPVLGPFECYNREIIVFNKEKFAELIVNEFATALTSTISIAGKENTRLLAGNGKYSGKLAVPVEQLEDILKHFGVE